MNIGIVTCQNLPNLPEDEQSLLPLYAAMGITPHILIWDDPTVSWDHYDALLVRSPWDYSLKFEAFLAWLEHTRPVPLWNPRPLIAQNLDKHYLLDLQQQGIATCQTWIVPAEQPLDLADHYQRLGAFVVKPTISASGLNTFCFRDPPSAEQQNAIDTLRQSKTLMVQPFYSEIETEGEWSLIYIAGAFSHAVLKTPQKGQFLIHEEYGGSNQSVQVSKEILDQVSTVIDRIPQPWLYARVDGVISQGQFLVMELELAEPSLYLGYDPLAPQKFVTAVYALLTSGG